MNSSRARPTPRFGIREKANAWCPDVHHDLDVDIGHCAHLGLLIRIVELARVDIAGVTFGARDRHGLAVGEFVCGASSTHHRGDAQLSRNDRGVAGAPPRFVTIAPARFMIGSQSGSVISATNTSPGANRCMSAMDLRTRRRRIRSSGRWRDPRPGAFPLAQPESLDSCDHCSQPTNPQRHYRSGKHSEFSITLSPTTSTTPESPPEESAQVSNP